MGRSGAAFGGAGGLHANALARIEVLEARRIVQVEEAVPEGKQLTAEKARRRRR